MESRNDLNTDELTRYARQTLIPSIGEEGQKKIKGSNVFVAGAGGLGSICAFYLAAAGVGRMTIVDSDKVEATNLNRQILYSTIDIGTPKVLSAKKKLEALNPHCLVKPIHAEMGAGNILDLIGDCGIIVDATDNIETRRVLNSASLQRGIPFIYGGVREFDGMITSFVPGRTPCFDCLFPALETPKRTIGVVGPVPGVIGSLQVLEVLKIILGLGGLLAGRLIFFSAVDMSFREIQVMQNPHCPVCGTYPREERNL